MRLWLGSLSMAARPEDRQPRIFRLRERREVSQVTQAEVFEEGWRRREQAVIVEGNQLALQQRADGAVAAGAADALDAGLADQLAVSDDRQDLHGGPRQRHRSRRIQMPLD